MFALQDLALDIESDLNIDVSNEIFDTCPNILRLNLHGNFSNINFDRFLNLIKLSISGSILDGFNFDLFQNICNQLVFLKIGFNKMNNSDISRLLNGHTFSKVLDLEISTGQITSFENKQFDGFPILETFFVEKNPKQNFNDNAFRELINSRKIRLKLKNDVCIIFRT